MHLCCTGSMRNILKKINISLDNITKYNLIFYQIGPYQILNFVIQSFLYVFTTLLFLFTIIYLALCTFNILQFPQWNIISQKHF